MKQHEIRWSWSHFFIGLLNKKFLAWIVATFFTQQFVHNGQSDEIKKLFIVAWGAITIIWMLSSAFETFVENGKLNMEVKI